MSTVPPPAPTFTAEPPKSSSGGCLKGLGCGCVVLLLLCCGGGGLTFWWGGNLIKDSVSTNPADVARIGNEIATFDVPQGFDPKFSLDVTLPFVGHVGKAAIYVDKDECMIVLAEAGEALKGMTPDEVNAQIQNAGPQGQGQQQQLRVINSRKEQMTIKGQESTVTINEAEDVKTQKQVWEVIAPFPGPKGQAFCFMKLSRDEYDEDQIKQILASIK